MVRTPGFSAGATATGKRSPVLTDDYGPKDALLLLFQ
jgi:hypothetical protein